MRPSTALSGRATAKALRRAASGRMTDFGTSESGAMIIFGLIIFVLMLLIGGMAVDLMRFETTRSRLQSTADRASLAAASLSQTSDPTGVVQDYFAKEGLSSYLTGVTVTQAFNYRRVNAKVKAEVPSMFMQIIGIDSLQAPANSTAEERITDVEIALVLDVSGSMTDNNKIANLRTAAKAFVDTVLAGDVDNKISISIVPFNGQVNLGATLAARYNITTQHTLHTCVDFPSSAFGTTAISPTASLTRADVIDPWDGTWYKPKPNGVTEQNYCTTDTRTIVRPFLRDVTTLKAAITGLVAEGNTSIDLGVKWGLALLDPGSQSVITSLIAANQVPGIFAGRPYAFNRTDTAKVIVVMSDGENTVQFQVESLYKSGNAPIYRRSSDGALVIYNAAFSGSSDYYVLLPIAFSTSYTSGRLGTFQTTLPSGYTQLTWPQVFNYHPVYWVARYLYGNALGSSSSTRQSIATTWAANFQASTSPATKDAQLKQICNLAKSSAANVRVFTIAFEAPAAGIAALSNCASASGDFFNVAGLNITTAFQSIARQINQLKLTQ